MIGARKIVIGKDQNSLHARPKKLAQAIVDDIMDRVRNNILQPGDKLPTESDMMTEFGVSRTTIREAVSKLQASSVVETKHGIGTFVLSLPVENLLAAFNHSQSSPMTIRDVIAMMELRISVEVEAAGLAATRATEKQIAVLYNSLDEFTQQIEQHDFAIEADKAFHMAIAEATQNNYFIDIFSYLGEVIPRSRLNTLSFSKESKRDFLDRTYQEHKAIYQAIANKESEMARTAMRAHLTSSLQRLTKALELVEKHHNAHIV